MNFLNIPVIMYFGNETVQGQFTYPQSDYLFDLLMNSEQRTWEYEGDNLDPAKIVNELFNENFFDNRIKFYGYGGIIETPYYNTLYNKFKVQITKITTATNRIDKFYYLNGFERTLQYGYTLPQSSYIPSTQVKVYAENIGSATEFNLDYIFSSDTPVIEYYIPIYPENLFNEDGSLNSNLGHNSPRIYIYTRWHNEHDQYATCKYVYINIQRSDWLYAFSLAYNGFNLKKSGAFETENDNPYSIDGNSTTGGGDGTLGSGGLDSIDPADIPDLPTVTAADIGFMTMYNPSKTQLKSLADFMWSGAFDLDSYKKLFSDPMESVIGLAIVPIAPTIGGAKNVHFGTIDSGVSMPTIATQFVQLDCGSVALEKYVGCFMDNDPYTKISIYLPYIGIRQLSADDLIGGSIKVVYNVDVLTGACGCFIKHSTRGVLYSFNGSCITNVPLTAINFSGAIQNAVSAVISGIGTVAGMATGAAPITAMGAMGLLNSAANTALNSKPSIQRSGNLGGSAGIMSIQKPYVIIERPNISVPSDISNYVGNTLNVSEYLYNCHGFTLVEYCHIHGIWGTENELKEIEALLKEGVML